MHWALVPLLVVGLVTGALAALIATRSAAGRPDRWLAAALALVSVNYLLGWLAAVLAGDARASVSSLADAAGFLDPFFFLMFAASLEGPLTRRRRAAMLAWGAAAATFALWRLFFAGDVAFRAPGPFLALGFVANAAMYAIGLFLLVAHYERSVLEGGRARLRPLVAGALVVIPTRVALLATDVGLSAGAGLLVDQLVQTAIAMGLVTLVTLRLRARLDAAERERARPYLLAAYACVALVSLTWVLEIGGLRYSLRWIIFAFLVAYGISREGFLSVDRNVMRSVRWGIPVAAGAATFIVLQPVLRPFATHQGPETLAGWTIGGALGLAVGGGLALAQLRAPGADAGDQRARRAESYRQLVEAALETGHDPEEARFAAVRAELGLTRADHEETLRLVRAAQETARLRGPEGIVPPGYVFDGALPSNETTWVVRARDPSGRRVVVKSLRPEWRGHAVVRETFVAELRLLRELAHPHLVRVLALDEEVPRAVFEFAEGGTLAQRVRERGRLDDDALLALAREALSALAHLHARGWVHRDVKPENVLFDASGRVLLADLGVAAPAPTGSTRVAGAAGAQQGPGTPAYMAPEQLRGERVTPATDVYALAATLVFAATGRHYLDAEALDPFELQRRVLEWTPRVPALDEDLAALLAACLAKDPAARPRDATAALAMLDARRHPSVSR